MPNIKIAPSVLSADFTKLGSEVHTVELAGAHQIHVDVMDGRFVPNITMGPIVVEAIKRSTRLPVDVHLMIVEPERHLDAFVRAGADMLTVHYEVSPHLHRTLQAIRQLGIKAGLALNPHTPAAMIQPVIHLVDIVLVMTVNPGFGGQHFLRETLPKIRSIRDLVAISGSETDISVDGGIAPDTTEAVLEAGANVLVAGSAIFDAEGGPEAGMQAMREAVAAFAE